MTRLLALTVLAAAALLARPALPAECTHDLAAQGIAILSGVDDTLPDTILESGPNAGLLLVETLTSDQLSKAARNAVAGRHWVDALRLAMQGQCVEPLTADERSKATVLVNRLGPWADAWDAAVPAEMQRRASDKAAAEATCETAANLQLARQSLAAEQANPSGVVDLVALHSWGQQVQILTRSVATRKALFQRDRGKPFSPAMCAPAR